MSFRERDLERRFPSIPWRTPISLGTLVPHSKTTDFGCRYCIAMNGLRVADFTSHPQNAEEFKKHLRIEHGLETDASSGK
jgi:hypothetical protein